MPGLLLEGRNVLVAGVANKKSVAFAVDRVLVENGARVVHVVRDGAIAADVRQIFAAMGGARDVLTCDVRVPSQIEALPELLAQLATPCAPLHGFVHSIAFANYERGLQPFHATAREDFLAAVDVSCFSLTAMTRALVPCLAEDSSVVTLSISDTALAAESYGYMAPIKAALETSVVFLAKSLAQHGVRVNAVKAGPLKTSASAGIPGYLDNYQFAEAATLRHRALQTSEVAQVVAFLLSPLSSGINAQGLVVDAGMGHNFFDKEIVARFSRALQGP